MKINKESHNYDHSHSHEEIKNTKNIKVTFYLNFIFACIELLVGLFSNSIALMSNGVHDFGDSAILLSTLKLEKFSYKGRDDRFTYGYRRFSLIGAILNSVILIVGSTLIIIAAINRILHPEVIKENLVMIFAILGIIINFIGAYKVSRNDDLVSKSLKKNLLMDAINWIIILIGSIIISFTGYYFVDSILSLIVALTMMISVFKDLNEIFYKLMQAAPEDIDIKKIYKIIMNHDNVLDCHDLHVWDLDGDDYISSFHIVVSDNMNETQIMYTKESLKHKLEEYKINHTTIEIDTKTQAMFNNEIKRV